MQFVTDIINDLEVLADSEGFTLKLTPRTIFQHLDMCFAFVQSVMNKALEDLEDMENHYDCYDKSDWEDAQAVIDFADKMLCDLSILQDLGTSHYADDDRYMDSIATLLGKFNSQMDAMNNDLPEFNKYYLDQLTKCMTEILGCRKGA